MGKKEDCCCVFIINSERILNLETYMFECLQQRICTIMVYIQFGKCLDGLWTMWDYIYLYNC